MFPQTFLKPCLRRMQLCITFLSLFSCGNAKVSERDWERPRSWEHFGNFVGTLREPCGIALGSPQEPGNYIFRIVQIQYGMLRSTCLVLYCTRILYCINILYYTRILYYINVLYNTHALYTTMKSILQGPTPYFYTLHSPLPWQWLWDNHFLGGNNVGNIEATFFT
jgi:hypothetical protein